MVAPRKTHCKYGHPLSGENLIVTRPAWAQSNPKFERRFCRTCRQRHSQERNERKKSGDTPGRVGAPRKDVCSKGHPKTMENLIISYSKRLRGRGEEYWYPVRICRTCQRESTRKRREAQKEAKKNGTS